MTTNEFISVGARQLRQALRPLGYVVERRNTYPVLGMVRLVLDAEGLTVSSTDLDILVSQRVEVRDAAGVWSICLPATLLASILAFAGDGGVTIERTGPEAARVSLDQSDLFGSATYDLDGLAPDAFPEPPGEAGAQIEMFGNGRLATLLDRVAWAVGREDTRFYLCGVAWQFGPFGRRVAATDGHRLVTCTYDRAPGANALTTRLLPTKLVGLLRHHCAGADIMVREVRRGDEVLEQLHFNAGAMTIRAKMIDLGGSNYPDLDRVMPRRDGFKAAFGLDRAQIGAAIAGSMVFVGREQRQVALTFSRDASGMMAVSTRSPDRGQSSIVLPVQWPEDGVSFGVNARYLREVLASCGGQVTLRQTDASAPITILDEDESMVRVLMPMRV